MPLIFGRGVEALERGYHAVYREHEVNHCPGCGRTHWLIGRMSAGMRLLHDRVAAGRSEHALAHGPAIIQHKIATRRLGGLS